MARETQHLATWRAAGRRATVIVYAVAVTLAFLGHALASHPAESPGTSSPAPQAHHVHHEPGHPGAGHATDPDCREPHGCHTGDVFLAPVATAVAGRPAPLAHRARGARSPARSLHDKPATPPPRA
ncbi:hypothetical protein [Roseovarius salinarum]|uniref:hypothetical protein n=1 Tax=Roseovarius salinarum TaxID=1981892 RepID=UPI0012FFF587|nr:hypothetical protein [Roseovarius salinarum]